MVGIIIFFIALLMIVPYSALQVGIAVTSVIVSSLFVFSYFSKCTSPRIKVMGSDGKSPIPNKDEETVLDKRAYFVSDLYEDTPDSTATGDAISDGDESDDDKE